MPCFTTRFMSEAVHRRTDELLETLNCLCSWHLLRESDAEYDQVWNVVNPVEFQTGFLPNRRAQRIDCMKGCKWKRFYFSEVHCHIMCLKILRKRKKKKKKKKRLPGFQAKTQGRYFPNAKKEQGLSLRGTGTAFVRVLRFYPVSNYTLAGCLVLLWKLVTHIERGM
jgi:hypothetical protein